MGIFCTNISWYLSLTYTNVRRKSIGKKKRIEQKEKKEKGYYIPIQDHPLFQAEAGAHCSYLLWAIYMAVGMPGHGDLTALHIVPNGFIVTLWTPTA